MNRTQITSVKAEITPGSFTFRKAYGREVLGTFQGGQEDVLHMQSYPEGEKLGAIKSIQPSLNLLIVNTNPFGAFHTLLVPRWGEDLPQELTLYALHLGIQYSAQCSGYQKLVFNSIGAGASINNLHWQVCCFTWKNTSPNRTSYSCGIDPLFLLTHFSIARAISCVISVGQRGTHSTWARFSDFVSRMRDHRSNRKLRSTISFLPLLSRSGGDRESPVLNIMGRPYRASADF